MYEVVIDCVRTNLRITNLTTKGSNVQRSCRFHGTFYLDFMILLLFFNFCNTHLVISIIEAIFHYQLIDLVFV